MLTASNYIKWTAPVNTGLWAVFKKVLSNAVLFATLRVIVCYVERTPMYTGHVDGRLTSKNTPATFRWYMQNSDSWTSNSSHFGDIQGGPKKTAHGFLCYNFAYSQSFFIIFGTCTL